MQGGLHVYSPFKDNNTAALMPSAPVPYSAIFCYNVHSCRYTLSVPTWIGPGGNVTCTLL